MNDQENYKHELGETPKTLEPVQPLSANAEKRELTTQTKNPPNERESTLPSFELACANGSKTTKNSTVQTEKLSRRGGDAIEWRKLITAWNDHRGLLPRADALNAARHRALKRLVDEHGVDEALALLVDATKQVARDEFWVERAYGFDNLLRPGRVVEKAEKYRATPAPLSAGERRMAVTAAKIAHAIGGWK